MPPEQKNNSGKKKARERKAAPESGARKVNNSHPLSPADSRPVAASKQRPATAATPKQPSIAIIGAGRLGSALALALSQSGYTIAALVTRRTRHARLSALPLNPRPLALDATGLNSLPDTDFIFITTPDDQIAEVTARLAQALTAGGRSSSSNTHPPRRRIALHASGALTSDALAALGEHGFSVASLHPLVSVSDAESGARNLRGAFYCLEGEARALREARKMVRALNGQSFSVAARDKSLYHAAAVIASGHTIALFSLAATLLARCGLSEAHARRVLLPLLASTLANLEAHAPEEALTGTFARADLTTVRKHLAALEDANVSDALAIYALLGERSLQLAARRNEFDAPTLSEIARLLRQALRTTPAE